MELLGCRDLVHRLATIRQGLTDVARLYALRILAQRRSAEKLESAIQFVRFAECAASIDQHKDRYFQVKPSLVCWSEDAQPNRTGILASGSICAGTLSRRIDLLSGAVSNAAQSLRLQIRRLPLFAPVESLLAGIQSLLPPPGEVAEITFNLQPSESQVEGAFKTLAGPATVGIDPAFCPGFSLMDEAPPHFGASAAQVAPHFWNLSMREAFASDLCALSACEYDRLPLAFYCDMAKQAWDEMRHAVFYFDAAIALLPECQSSLDPDSPLHDAIRRYLASGSGLPVPRERNLYEAFWNATLVERLVLMQLRTETPAIQSLAERIKSDFAKSHPEIALAFEIDRFDERSHSRIGATWLKHLVPDAAERARAIEKTDLIRSALFLTTFAHHGAGRLSDLLARYSSGERVPE